MPRNLLLGMAFSAIVAFPPLWRTGGPLADSGLPGMSRALLALALPAICGLVGTAYGLDAFIHPAIA
uniref:hypothetical protein n=1 Tax=Edaphosphingomonas laterariae TaxID=861865 RepID=UPI001C532895|nr:hypothetical protein [Sphingomonas laterariae]